MRPEPPTIRTQLAPRIATLADFALALDVDQTHLATIVSQAPTLYTKFQVAKKSGGFREITPPKAALRSVQRAVYRLFEGLVRYPRWMMGGVPHRSIFAHARPHVERSMVAALDVKSFFPSVAESNVRAVFSRFNLVDEALDAAVRLTTRDNQLPQGSPASCFLANLALDSPDRRIDALCRRHGLTYTRYVDDLAISGNSDLRSYCAGIIDPIMDAGFRIATEKTCFMGRHEPQVVTNLVVNDKLRPTTAFIRQVTDDIWSCLRGGGPYVLALSGGLTVAKVKSMLTGRVSHIAQADPVLGRKLRGRLYGVDWRMPLELPAENLTAIGLTE